MKLCHLFAPILAMCVSVGCSAAPIAPPPPRSTIAQDLKEQTVQLLNPVEHSLCAGVWITPQRIMTAAHCVHDADQVLFRSSSADPQSATVKFVDEGRDLAMVEADDAQPEHQVATLRGTLPEVGESVLVMGHPHGLQYSFSTGVVSAIRTFPEDFDGEVIQTDAAVNPGNSGGGMFDEQGRLLAICSFQVTGAQGLNFFIPLTDLPQ